MLAVGTHTSKSVIKISSAQVKTLKYIFLAHRTQPPDIHLLPARKVKRPSKSSSEVVENCEVMNHSHSKLMASEWHGIFLYNVTVTGMLISHIVNIFVQLYYF